MLKSIVIVKFGASNRISIDVTSMLITINHSVLIRFILPFQTIDTLSFYHQSTFLPINPSKHSSLFGFLKMPNQLHHDCVGSFLFFCKYLQSLHSLSILRIFHR